MNLKIKGFEESTTNQNKRVVVAMSGGVDSSVAAALLVEQGYEVIGIMMRLWSEPDQGLTRRQNRCCTPDQMADARKVSDFLGIPFYVIDVQDYFFKNVVEFFIDDHIAGRTPNPCIECNRKVRFSYLYDYAMSLDADFLATGHYACIEKIRDEYFLKLAKDLNKDQSYVLHVLNQEKLAHLKFPIGSYEKSEVYTIASNLNLPIARKDESMDLCFLADGDYRRFLKVNAPDITNPGPIIKENGEVIGQHDGLFHFTIGQRKGLGIAEGRPLFVLNKEATTNSLRVGPREKLGKGSLFTRDVNWISGKQPKFPTNVDVKIRYRAIPVPASLSTIDNSRVVVKFDDPVFGITPGQGAAFYKGDVCIGGGIIADEVI